MAVIKFETINFQKCEESIKGIFLKTHEFIIKHSDLEKIGNYIVENKDLLFPDKKQEFVDRKFSLLLEEAFKNLKNRVTKKPALYVHRNSGIPLIGNIAFGVLDRGTNIIEIRPISGCNIRCVYCSVSDDARVRDVVVEREYLVQEFKKLVEFKKTSAIEAHIAAQGEPTLYGELVSLIQDLSCISEVGTISIDTNGTLLNEIFIDELISAGLTRFNFSLNSMDEETAKKIANAGYNHKRVLGMIKYISTRAELIIAPVLVQGWNDKEMSSIIEFAKSLKNEKFTPKICIQNYLYYKYGRNPAKQLSFEEFYKMLENLEKKHCVKLIVSKEDFKIEKLPTLEKPFKKGQTIEAEIVGEGRLPNEKLAVAKERVISVISSLQRKKTHISITRSKHNIFYGVAK
ncbi:radical SAM protein [Candidatus Woesearchaeota archaeon]|nr:radical SAM protein [Candidatus Woesearchaeota archaeon]